MSEDAMKFRAALLQSCEQSQTSEEHKMFVRITANFCQAIAGLSEEQKRSDFEQATVRG